MVPQTSCVCWGGLPWPLRVGCLLLAGRSPQACEVQATSSSPREAGCRWDRSDGLTEPFWGPWLRGQVQSWVLRLQRERQPCLGEGPPRASLPALTHHSQRLVLQSWEIVTPEKCRCLKGDPSVDSGDSPLAASRPRLLVAGRAESCGQPAGHPRWADTKAHLSPGPWGCAALPPSRKAKALKAWWLKPGAHVWHTWCTRMCRRVYAYVLGGPRGGASAVPVRLMGVQDLCPVHSGLRSSLLPQSPRPSGSAGGVGSRGLCVCSSRGAHEGRCRPTEDCASGQPGTRESLPAEVTLP